MTTLIVKEKRTLARDVVGLRLLPADGGKLPPWSPGAHIDLHLPGGLVRQYSLCGDPAERSSWQVAVLREPDGRGGSACVHDYLAAGDHVDADGPRTSFPLADACRYLFIAGGIGITPILPMLAAARAPWRLAYGGRSASSMAFLDELARWGDRVTVWPQDEHGLLDLEALLGDPHPGTAVYCCGPEPLLRAVEARCPAGMLRVERFHASGVGCADGPLAVPASSAAFQVELAGDGRVVDVPAGVSVLAALRAAGLDVLSSCEGGTCGTCETGVLDGVPDHRDSILTPAERESVTDFMMICVSRARTPRLILDL